MLVVEKCLVEPNRCDAAPGTEHQGDGVELPVARKPPKEPLFPRMARRPLATLGPVEDHRPLGEPWQDVGLHVRSPVGTLGVDEENESALRGVCAPEPGPEEDTPDEHEHELDCEPGKHQR